MNGHGEAVGSAKGLDAYFGACLQSIDEVLGEADRGFAAVVVS